jgi:hypothetical protein
MFTKTQSPAARLAAWRTFRQHFPTNGTANDVVEAFANVTLTTRYIDYYTPHNWLDVFEIVKNGYFCQSGLTLVIASTLVHLNIIKSPVLYFDVVSNHITGADGLVFRDNGKCYNFLPGEIVEDSFAAANSTKFTEHIITPDKLCC